MDRGAGSRGVNVSAGAGGRPTGLTRFTDEGGVLAGFHGASYTSMILPAFSERFMPTRGVARKTG